MEFLESKTARIIRQTVLFTVFNLSILGTTTAQNNDFKQTFTDAEYYFLMQDYREALPLYRKLYGMDSTNANINFRLGQCYLNIPGIKYKAIPFLEQATKNITTKYNEGSYKETHAPTIAIFHLGEAYMVSNKPDKALEKFEQFKDRLDVKDVYNLDYVNQEIEACINAKGFITKPIKIETEKFVPFPERNKNSNYPVLSGDRKRMVFTVKEKFYSAIYFCEKDNEKWSTPTNITLDLVVEGEIYSTSLNYDGTTLLIFRNDNSRGNIYYSNFVNGKWQPVKKFSNEITSKDWETFASFSVDGKHLLFTSNRKGGLGGLDIYIADLMPNGEWGNIKNLEIINTPYNEESPILSSDGKTLYFASQGHNTMGGFDIFYSKLLPDNKWSVPINMGYPINTPDDEFYYFPIDSVTALMPLVSNELETYFEIYKVEIKPNITNIPINIAGKVTLSDDADLGSDSIVVTIKRTQSPEEIIRLKPSTQNGEFRTTLKPGTYIVETVSKFYDMSPVNIFIPENYNQATFPINLVLTPNLVTQGLALKIKNILFDFDSYALTRNSKFELEKVYNLMEANPSLYIEVCGHTDSKGSPAYNLKLSSKRAKSVVDYLTNKGINGRRFIVKGLGALSCVASNVNPDGSDNPVGRSLNRRASIRIFSGNKSVEIDNVDVPENLKPQNLTYTILLVKPGDEFNSETIKDIEKALNTNSSRTDIGSAVFINIGSFTSKSKAIATLNKIIDMNLPDATLVSEQELQRLIQTEQQQRVGDAVYTILLMTSESQVNSSKFRGFKPIEEKGDDELYRYYFGNFTTKELAQKQLEKIYSLGFPNAMVVKIK
ncbi:MAG: OmpA family protein [Bacteroidales bacterium]